MSLRLHSISTMKSVTSALPLPPGDDRRDGDGRRPVLQEAADLGQGRTQGARRRHVQHRGRKGAVQRHRPVQPLLHQPRDGQGDVAGQLLALVQEAQVELADGEVGGGAGAHQRVGRLDRLADPAHRLVALALQPRLGHALAAHGQGQADHRVAQVGRHGQRRGMIVVARHVEGGAVGQDARGAGQGEHAGAQKRGVHLQRGEAPRQGAQRLGVHPHHLLKIALELLEVLGAQEHALRPQHLVLPVVRHQPAPAAPAHGRRPQGLADRRARTTPFASPVHRISGPTSRPARPAASRRRRGTRGWPGCRRCPAPRCAPGRRAGRTRSKAPPRGS